MLPLPILVYRGCTSYSLLRIADPIYSAQLVDFELTSGTEPLLQWISNYFSGGNPQPKTATVGEALRGSRPIIVTDKLPIVLQHNGHSRTIVGYEQGKGGAIYLLTFDPST